MARWYAVATLSATSLLAVAQDSSEYVRKAQILKSQKQYAQVYALTEECVKQYSQEADRIAQKLDDFPSDYEASNYQVMNDVALCYFIKGEAMRDEAELLASQEDTKQAQALRETAKELLRTGIAKYPYAKGYDAHGWYYKIADISHKLIAEIDGTFWEPEHVVYEEKKVVLYDPGDEFPVNYSAYGEFQNIGTQNYNYKITDPIGLSKAVGEGIHPNTTSVKFDPEYIKIKKQLPKINHWKIMHKRDYNTAFYKWIQAPESPGVRLFNIAQILERSGYIEHAIKAFYAILVHYPTSYGWTYWHTPWYIARVAKYRLAYLIKKNPDLGLVFEGADIEVRNGYDNNIRNDRFIVNPGKIYRPSFWQRKLRKISSGRRKPGKVVQTRGGDMVKLLQYKNGDWQLRLNGKPIMIKAVTYSPSRVGESPHKGTLQNWSTQDTNQNGIIDAPFESWVDKNANNIKDPDEPVVGDFQLLKEMGANAIRLYHQPVALNKEILRQMYEKYGIYVLLGDFLGKYTLGSGAEWEKGTDYDNEQDKQNMLKSVETMVNEFKDEPYVLLWLLGNENVYGLGCNADKKPESFFAFANEAARLIKKLDPKQRPVAIVSGDTLYLDIFAKNCPDIDIFGTNAYRGQHGFLDIWDEVKRVSGKAAMITEYGVSAYAQGYTYQEAEDYQAEYHLNAWNDIMDNSYGSGAGNAIGGVVFEFVDEWWKAYAEKYHNREGLFSGPFLDGYMHEEWLGITGQGDGNNSPFLRRLRKAYYTYKKLWR